MEFLTEKIYGKNNLGISVSKAFLVRTPSSSLSSTATTTAPRESKFRHVEKCRGFTRTTTTTVDSLFLQADRCRQRLADTFDDLLPTPTTATDLSEFNRVNSQIMKFEAGNYFIY
jgi:hypothetical protein